MLVMAAVNTSAGERLDCGSQDGICKVRTDDVVICEYTQAQLVDFAELPARGHAREIAYVCAKACTVPCCQTTFLVKVCNIGDPT